MVFEDFRKKNQNMNKKWREFSLHLEHFTHIWNNSRGSG